MKLLIMIFKPTGTSYSFGSNNPVRTLFSDILNLYLIGRNHLEKPLLN
jgi:hypothetical protein